jgi:hypothetical protein
LQKDVWLDIVLNVTFSQTSGVIRAWVNGQKVLDVSGVPTQYTGEKYVTMWEGGYRPGTPKEPNNTQLAAFQHEACRVGKTLSEALADVPTEVGAWGSVVESGAPAGTSPSSAVKITSQRQTSDFVLPAGLQ